MLVYDTMKHLILGLYIMILASGCAGFIALQMMKRQLDEYMIRLISLIHLFLSCGIILVGIYYYLNQIMGIVGRSDRFEILFGIAGSFCSIGILISLHALLRHEHMLSRLLGLSLSAAAFAQGLGTVFHVILIVSGKLAGVTSMLSLVTMILIMISCAYSGYLFITASPQSTDRRALLFHLFGICILLFVPFTLLEMVITSPIEPLSFDFLLYLGVNLTFIVVMLKQEKTHAQEPVEDHWNLTSREREILPLVAEGLTNKEIAALLHISPVTVRTHLTHLFQKTGTASRTELVSRVYILKK